jgi:Tol biopolymer transport system component
VTNARVRKRVHSFDADVYWREPDGRIAALSPGDGLYMMSCIHPSGTHAVFWGGTSGRPRLWVGDGSGTFEPITDGKSAARYPAFNTQGDTLVYCRSSHESEVIEQLRMGRTVMPPAHVPMTIVVRAADGSWEREITDGRHQDQRPALSPDGSQVVFVSNRRAPYELWTVGTTASARPSLLLSGMRAYRPWWSVDGRHIFFFTMDRTGHRLHLIPAGGGRPRPLANDGRGNTHGPYADPDARNLIAHSTRGTPPGMRKARWALYEFPLDGSPPRLLGPGAHGTRARNGAMTYDIRRPH